MNRQNQDRADKVAHVYKKSRKVRIADEVLKRALTDCMQEEANQVQKKMEREGQHAFSKPFIEKMQFVLKLGKQAEEQQKKKDWYLFLCCFLFSCHWLMLSFWQM